MAESKLARSLRVKLQLRDKKGRWIEMGRGGKWYSSLEGKEKSGIVIGSNGNTAILREKNADGSLGTKNVQVPMNQLEMIPSKASLDPESVKLMDEFNKNQSAKGKKESAARESALATAKDNYAKGVSIDDEAEVEYEVSAQEELEDLLDNAPEGAMLLKNDGTSKAHSLKKGKNNNWEDGLYAPLPSNAIANSPSYAKNYEYVGGGETAKKVNDLFDEIANNKPVKEKKSWFGKKNKDAETAEDVDPLDSLIKSTDEMLAEFDKNQNSSINPQDTAPAAPEVPEAVVSPEPEALIDISQWKYHQGTQGGSNPGGIYSDPEGNQHYVKHSKSDMHAKNEVLADKFYEMLGIKTSQLKLADVGDGKMGTSSKMVPGSKNDFYDRSYDDPAYLKKFQEDFAVDAWLANWDVVGLEYDNVLSDENGDAIRIDPGGALLYRAMGSPKGDMFGDEVGEWESMRNGTNPASQIFGSMTDEDLKNSAAKLNNISEQDIADIVDSMDFEPDVADYLKNTLAARKKNILDKFPELANEQANTLPEEELPQDVVPEAPAAPEMVPEATAPETSAPQVAKPEDITTGTAENPFETTPEPLEDAPESFSAKMKQFQQQAESGKIIDLSEFQSTVDGGDQDDEDYWEGEDEDIPSAFKGHFGTYSFSDTNALSEYVADSADINNVLRGKKKAYEYLSDEEFKDAAGVINDLDSLISRSVLQEDFSVFRGIAMKKESLDSFLDSKMYQDLAFTSTSENSGLANGWASVDPEFQPDRVHVTMEIKLPAGFTAHRVDYLAADAKMFANEQEVLLPRGSKFGIVGVEEGTGGIKGSKNVHLIMEPVLNDSNFKTEGIKNGSNNTGDSGNTNGDLPAAPEAAVEESNDNGGGGHDNSDSGTGSAGDAGQSESEELQDPVAPEATSEEHSELDKLIEAVEGKINAPAKSASEEPENAPEEDSIAPINGADAILFAMAGKEGISVDALKNSLGIGADGKFPNKGKKVTNDGGDAFEANAIVTNPKFGEGIASIILPSTNSVKVLYKDHGFKVTQAKNLSLVGGTVPDEVASEALDLSNATPGDVGTNPANGKMYFVDKNGNAQYVGDEVEYTKKGVTQHGKVSAIYKGTKTSKIEWDDDTASVKKASQLIGKKESSEKNSDSSETAPEADTTDAPAVDETPETYTEESPEEASEASDTPEAPTTPEAPEEAAEAATEAPTNKGHTPAPAGYDPMGPTLIQIHPNMDKATVYPHDHSQNEKESYKLKGVVKYNPVEEQYFGVGHNLQPLYAGDKVSYLFGGKKFQGEIIEVKPKSESAVVLLDDGQKKLKKFSQLSGNQPKTVDVDENGNYTDWNGNAQQIPNFKKNDSSEDSSETPETTEVPAEDAPEVPETPEAVEPEAPQVSKPEWGDVVMASTGQAVTIDGKTYVKLPYIHSTNWWDPEKGTDIPFEDFYQKFEASTSDVVLSEVPTPSYTAEELEALGTGAVISSRKLGTTFTRDYDGDWYSDATGYVKPWSIIKHLPSDDWQIENKGEEKPSINPTEHGIGDTITVGGQTYVKLGGAYSESWWNTETQTNYSDSDMLDVLVKADNTTARLGEKIESSLDEDDKSNFHEGAELSSEKLGLTITKDSDGDWMANQGSFGYIDDSDVFDVFVADDWEINEYGQAKSNLSEYDLDSANGYATLYSQKLEKNFEKDSEGSWISNDSGDSYTAEELLSEFPSDDWYVEDSEIDDDYEYSVDISGLKLGSKISHTDSPHDSPDDYQLIAEDTWALLDVYGKPTGTTYTSETFSDGYGKITHAADDDEEFEAPQAYTYESNTPNIDKKDISLDWLKSAPEGTIIKSAMSDKWSYEKNSEGKWETTDGWGVKTGAKGTDEQVYDASVDKHDLTNIYMPESAEPASDEPAPDVFDIDTVEVGTYIPHNGSDTTGYTKVDDNAWKMKVGDQEVDYLLEDDFIDAFIKATTPEIHKPEPVETPAAPEPEADLPEAEIPAAEVPEATTNTPALSDMTLSEFKDLPVGTKLASPSGMAVYEKEGDNSWKNTANNYGTVLDDTVFTNESGPIPIIHKYTMTLPEGYSPSANIPSDNNDSTDIPTPSAPEMTSKSFADISTDEFDNLPIGSKVTYDSGSKYTKVSDDGWESKSGMIIESTNFYDGIEVGVPATVQYFDNGDAPSVSADKNYPDIIKGMSKEDFADLPVGSLVDVENDSIYTKIGPNKWSYGSDEYDTVADDDFSGLTSSESPTTAVLTVPSAASSQPAPDLKSMSGDEFANLPTGVKLVNGIGANFEKVGPNQWKSASDPTGLIMQDKAFVISGYPSEYVKSYTVELPKNTETANTVETAPTAPSPQPISQPIFGMNKQDILDAPAGSTVTAPSGSVMTKGSDGTWTSDTNTQSDDIGSGIAWLTDKEAGKSYIFTPAPELKSLDKYTTEEVSAFPAGTIAHIKGVAVVYTKQENGDWLSPNGSKIPDSSMVDMAGDFLGEDWTMELPVATKSPFEGGLHKGVKLNKDLVDGYPVGTVFKNEFDTEHGYSNLSPYYYVKLEDGTWQKYKQTDKTLSAKDILESDQIAKWSAHKVSVSVPKSDEHFMTNSGALGYVGDTVLDDSGLEYTVTKLMKTGVKVTDANGVKMTIKPNKLHLKDSSFGKKSSAAPVSDPYSTAPTQASTPAAPMEPLNINTTSDWAGASAESYNDQGLVMPSNTKPMINAPHSLMPSSEANLDDPLYGTPMPVEPPKPNAYPSFQPPVKEPLPDWDSSEWLAKVEQRYLDNPNKAKASVQESNNWSTIQSAMTGDKPALEKLLASKYIDQDLMDEAIAGIDAQEELNKPLVDAHNAKVLKAAEEYDAAKALHTANYNELKAKYDSDFLAWAKANPNPDAMKPLEKPALSTENFTGGSVDWSKGHIGTHTADAVFEALKTDNPVATHGLSIATDSDKVEGLDISMRKILDIDGTEVFDMRFKVTKPHGKELFNWFKGQKAEKTSSLKVPNMSYNKSKGLLKESPATNTTGTGHVYTMKHEPTGATIQFNRDSSEDEFNNHNLHNALRIKMPATATTKEYEEVLAFLGIEGKPSTEGDIRVAAENRLINAFGAGDKISVGADNLKGADREKALKDIQTKYGITADNIELRTEPNGRVKMFFDAPTVDKLAKKFAAIKTFQHSLSSDTNADMYESMLTGSHPGLLSTFHRWSNGIGFSGASSSTDLQYGSGDYTYMTNKTDLDNIWGGAVAIHPKAVFQRLDLWVNKNDNYGKKNSGIDGTLGPFAMFDKHGPQVYETMASDGVPLNDIMFIKVNNDNLRQSIVKRLKDKGVLKINGVPVEDYIVVSGMPLPEYEYFPGFGLVPKGTTLEEAMADAGYGAGIDVEKAIADISEGGGPAA